MALVQVKAEIDAAGAAAADEHFLEEERAEWSVLEDAIARRAWVVGLFDSAAAAQAAWTELQGRLPARLLGAADISELADKDWRDSYKAHFKAWQFGRLHWVPVWERETHRLPAGHGAIWLDPGLAFGTGNHETTRLCCERLAAWAESRASGASRRVIDAGCGSGILALSAARLGCGPIEAFDLDPEAVRVSRENAALNGLESAVEFFVANLEEGLANSTADLVLANIQADVLVANARALLAALADGGTLVLSGILAGELDGVRRAFAGPWAMDSRVLGEWADLAITLSAGT
ncbi:MAG TPA: 50S ribosomal protein L11 methyltransferase [Opitutaceae bacterium]|jgi:ribosomal protein L11 methyltransferase|nr:50S ribosomal protein L11 methyltransferase [Opitutaceae bacterium]